MQITTTNNLEGYRILSYHGIFTKFQENEWYENIKYALEGIEEKAKDWVEAAIDRGILFEDKEIDVDNDFALIGVHIVSASTYGQDDYDGSTTPDIIAYGTLVRIERISKD